MQWWFYSRCFVKCMPRLCKNCNINVNACVFHCVWSKLTQILFSYFCSQCRRLSFICNFLLHAQIMMSYFVAIYLINRRTHFSIKLIYLFRSNNVLPSFLYEQFNKFKKNPNYYKPLFWRHLIFRKISVCFLRFIYWSNWNSNYISIKLYYLPMLVLVRRSVPLQRRSPMFRYFSPGPFWGLRIISFFYLTNKNVLYRLVRAP